MALCQQQASQQESRDLETSITKSRRMPQPVSLQEVPQPQMRTGECHPRLWRPGAEDPTKPGLLMHRTCDDKCALFKAAKFVVICYTLIIKVPGLDRVVREVSEEVTLKQRKEE